MQNKQPARVPRGPRLLPEHAASVIDTLFPALVQGWVSRGGTTGLAWRVNAGQELSIWRCRAVGGDRRRSHSRANFLRPLAAYLHSFNLVFSKWPRVSRESRDPFFYVPCGLSTQKLGAK
jgi:hypothetical protein